MTKEEKEEKEEFLRNYFLDLTDEDLNILYKKTIKESEACGLNLSEEYKEGLEAGQQGNTNNPYDYWNEYAKSYAWCIGNQVGTRKVTQEI